MTFTRALNHRHSPIQLKFSKENLAELALAIMQATRDNQTNPEYLSVTTRFLQDYSQLVQEEEIRVDTVVSKLRTHTVSISLIPRPEYVAWERG